MDYSLRYTEEAKKVVSNDLVLRLVKPRIAVLHKSKHRYLDAIMAAEGPEATQAAVEVIRMGTEVAQTASKWAGHTQS